MLQQTLKEYEVAKEDEFKTNTKSVDVRPILRSVTTQFPERQTHFKARAVQVDRILTADKSTSTDDLEIFCEISEYTDQLHAFFIIRMNFIRMLRLKIVENLRIS